MGRLSATECTYLPTSSDEFSCIPVNSGEILGDLSSFLLEILTLLT